MTQKANILHHLQRGDATPYCGKLEGETCASLFLSARMPRYSARIYELRQAGYPIDSGWCRQHKTATYRLVPDGDGGR